MVITDCIDAERLREINKTVFPTNSEFGPNVSAYKCYFIETSLFLDIDFSTLFPELALSCKLVVFFNLIVFLSRIQVPINYDILLQFRQDKGRTENTEPSLGLIFIFLKNDFELHLAMHSVTHIDELFFGESEIVQPEFLTPIETLGYEFEFHAGHVLVGKNLVR